MVEEKGGNCIKKEATFPQKTDFRLKS